ncbi:MAG: metallophosphoesterase [Pseudomonadota bacterium]
MRLLQISDCHLSADPEAEYRGQSPDKNLSRFSAAVRAYAPDWLILTGDVSDDASVESYERLCDWLSLFDIPVAWLPGNHDDRAIMEPVFEAKGFHAGPILSIGAWQLVLLDSAWPGRPDGELDELRLDSLDQIDSNRPAGIFIHHHPLPVSAWIDRVPLQQPERLWQKLSDLPATQFVAFGHVHQRFRQRYAIDPAATIECLAAPSTAANCMPGTDRFIPEHSEPMARWFVLETDGNYRSGLLSLGG